MRTLEGGQAIRERTQRGRRFVQESLNWNAIAARMCEIYDDSILEADRPRRHEGA